MNHSFNNLLTSVDRIKVVSTKVFVPCFRASTLPTLFTFILIFLILSLLPSSLEAQEKEKEERWFEIEVILFKLKSEDGLTNESWKDDSKLNISEDAVDFLQPYEILEIILDAQDSKITDAEVTDAEVTDAEVTDSERTNAEVTDAKISDDSANITSQDTSPNIETFTSHDGVDEYAPEEIEQSEQAFIRLSDDLLQLTSESKSIKRQRRYQLIEHFSWRQPVDSRANATKIRIAGGFDYSNEFEYAGEKKIEFIPLVEEVNEDSIFNQPNEFGEIYNSDKDLDKQLEDNVSINKELNAELLQNLPIDGLDSTEPKIIAEPKPLDWVPEIDGEIKVYIHRNYLHVDTNLVYRKPGEIAVDIFHLDEQPFAYSFADSNIINPNPLEQAPVIIESNSEGILPSPYPMTTTTNTSNFNLEFDSEFLNKKAEKLFTEKLFNYPLIQDRRIRSGELHYYDHPLIGMLIMIRPYETEVFEDELIDTETLESTD